MAISEMNVDLRVDPAIVLPDRANLIVYRLMQEPLNNAIKHSDATDLQLILSQQDNLVTIRYADNGKGFDYKQAYQKRSLGLKNIETRTQMLRGTIAFDTQPGQGLRVSVIIPTTN